jgi:hypothetical protein
MKNEFKNTATTAKIIAKNLEVVKATRRKVELKPKNSKNGVAIFTVDAYGNLYVQMNDESNASMESFGLPVKDLDGDDRLGQTLGYLLRNKLSKDWDYDPNKSVMIATFTK